jgi:hypothetical protein
MNEMAYKKVDWKNINLGIVRDRSVLDANIASMSTIEVVSAFAYVTSNYDRIIAYIIKSRPDVFDEFERRHLRLKTRVMVRGIKYLLERKDIEGISDDYVVEILYETSEPSDLEFLMNLPLKYRQRLDELISYHKHYDDEYSWIWEYNFASE